MIDSDDLLSVRRLGLTKGVYNETPREYPIKDCDEGLDSKKLKCKRQVLPSVDNKKKWIMSNKLNIPKGRKSPTRNEDEIVFEINTKIEENKNIQIEAPGDDIVKKLLKALKESKNQNEENISNNINGNSN